MAPTNLERSLRTFRRQSPFRSFTVTLVNGNRFRVHHPEALVVRNGVAVFFAADGEIWLFDHECVSQFEWEPAGKKPRRQANSNPEG